MKKKILALLLCAVLVFSILPMAGAAADPVQYLKYDASTGKFVNDTCTEYTVIDENNKPTEWSTGWYVVSGTVSLNDVTVTGDVNLILLDNCDLTATGSTYCPGIRAAGTDSLTIYAQSNGDSMGKLTATGGYMSAGIGGDGRSSIGDPANKIFSPFCDGGTITINGGMVTATSGDFGAGIGGGEFGAGGNITINGGTVTVTGGNSGAGIGSGSNTYDPNGITNITISGGTVTATSVNAAAAIGDGYYSVEGSNITISGGSINATASWGAGIGCSYGSFVGSNITISGGSINASSSKYGAGIGGGYGTPGSNITISGGSIAATGAEGYAAIGDGPKASSQSTITLNATMYDEDGNTLTADDLKGAATVFMTDTLHGPVPVVSVTTDAGTDVKYPGDTFTVTVTAADAADHSADVILTYNKDLVELASAPSAVGFTYGTATAGTVRIITADVPDGNSAALAALTFKVKEITEDADAVFTLTKYEFGSRQESMSQDAITATADPGSATVKLCAGYPVEFVDAYGAEVPVSSQVVVPEGNATVPAASGMAKTGYTFKGWADVTEADNDDVVIAADETTVKVTGTAKYKAVYALDITVTQDVDYIGGYVRVVVTGVLPNYSFNGNAMYKLADGTFAYLYAATKETALSDDAAKALVTANAAALAADHDLSGRKDIYDVNGTGSFDVADLRAAFNCANADQAAFAEFPYIDFIATCLRADVAKEDDEDHATVNATDVSAIIEALLQQ